MGNQKTGQKEGISADQIGIERWADNFSISQSSAKHFFTEQGAQEPSSQAQAQASSAALRRRTAPGPCMAPGSLLPRVMSWDTFSLASCRMAHPVTLPQKPLLLVNILIQKPVLEL